MSQDSLSDHPDGGNCVRLPILDRAALRTARAGIRGTLGASGNARSNVSGPHPGHNHPDQAREVSFARRSRDPSARCHVRSRAISGRPEAAGGSGCATARRRRRPRVRPTASIPNGVDVAISLWAPLTRSAKQGWRAVGTAAGAVFPNERCNAQSVARFIFLRMTPAHGKRAEMTPAPFSGILDRHVRILARICRSREKGIGNSGNVARRVMALTSGRETLPLLPSFLTAAILNPAPELAPFH